LNIADMHRMFKDRDFAGRVVRGIEKLDIERRTKIMHVCGTHEQTITKHGLRAMLPENVEVVAGPGCPVCITPAREVDEAVAIAGKGHIVATYGDMLKVPGTLISLAKARAKGADVRIVYSPEDAVEIARKKPDKEVVFFAIGFETTAPMTAQVLLSSPPENFSVLCSHRTIPSAMEFLLKMGDLGIDGFIDPGHVSTIIGVKAYEPLSASYKVPQVIAGFEPLDVLMGTFMLLKQMKNGEAKVENEYARSVDYEGNRIAQEMIGEVFGPCSKEWRGLPVIPDASLELKKRFGDRDARKKLEIEVPEAEGEVCSLECPLCGDILRGLAKPEDCELFGKSCTPENPVGACMVSTEGTCNVAYRFGKRL